MVPEFRADEDEQPDPDFEPTPYFTSDALAEAKLRTEEASRDNER